MPNKTPVVFQISSELNVGSVGRIAEQIGENILEQGWESYIAYGRESAESKSKNLKIGNSLEIYKHVLLTRLTDKHGFGSQKATLQLIEKIEEINPDIIHLQHVHGYYINIKVLFDYLKSANKPVVWTFHDCWSFTGHCAYYELVDCQKWQTECNHCPQLKEYPKSWFTDRSTQNFRDKKHLFTSVKNMTIVPVSYWLEGEVKKSFLKNFPIQTIQNGIDLNVFSPQKKDLKNPHNLSNDDFVILGVAHPWDTRKGLKYFVELSKSLEPNEKIILIGLSSQQIKTLPKGIIGLPRTNSVQQLAEYYSTADVFVNTTLEDTFPTTNLEALACGTPVVTFKSGGSPEAVDPQTGFVVEKGNIQQLVEAIRAVKNKRKETFTSDCRKRAEKLFDKKTSFFKYIEIYRQLLNL